MNHPRRSAKEIYFSWPKNSPASSAFKGRVVESDRNKTGRNTTVGRASRSSERPHCSDSLVTTEFGGPVVSTFHNGKFCCSRLSRYQRIRWSPLESHRQSVGDANGRGVIMWLHYSSIFTTSCL